jgi:hypothetical protein
MVCALIAVAMLSPVQNKVPIPLFNGKDLTGWKADVPANDGKPNPVNPFIVRGKMLVSLGTPMGHLITEASYENYRLIVEYRYTKQAGNCGIIVHTGQPRFLRDFLPKGIEAQLMSGNAGDFHLFGETLFKPGSTTERAGKNLTDGSENPIGQWNTIVVDCRADQIRVWVNGDFVNHGTGSSVTKGAIGLQSEGAEVEFRRIELTPF